MKKTGQKNISGYIFLKSGLRVGGSDDLLQIGATDLTCIKHPVTFEPYIPGSSFKGKLRTELEKREGKFFPTDLGTIVNDLLVEVLWICSTCNTPRGWKVNWTKLKTARSNTAGWSLEQQAFISHLKTSQRKTFCRF